MKNTDFKQGENTPLLPFVHLHTHTEYSLSDGLCKIPQLVNKAIADGMPGIAITDHANMFGVREFVEYVEKRNRELGTSFKPIIGCEVYVARRGKEKHEERCDWGGYHLVLLAKNATGYKNLVKIVSKSWLEGYCGRPRTDKADLERYHEGLICTSACIGGEVAQLILNDRLDEAEKAAGWYQSIFGEDYYLELQRHIATAERANHETYELEERANHQLRNIAQKLGIKLICANDIHFVNEEDAEAQDTLLCINFRAKYNDPDRLIFSKQEWLKTTAEMNELFGDIPEALANTMDIYNKVELYPIDHAPMLPAHTLPEGVDEVEHLARLAFQGAHKRFGEHLTAEVKERLKQELKIINRNGFTAYFLMWHEIISAARELGAQVGPGRGSAASSLVNYCLGITQVDPLHFGLSYERFLSPTSATLPMIDVDLDEEGRKKILSWITARYGEERVANIVTFGRTTAKGAETMVARIYDVKVEELDENARRIAKRIETTVQKCALHACGVAICAEDISNRVPLAFIESTNEDYALVATQYDAEHLKNTGVVQLNILSLKTLGIVKRCIELCGVDIENIPIDDEATFDLLRRGDTESVFQFDSEEMRRLLREEQPTNIEELVAIYSHHCKSLPHSYCYTLLAYQTAYLKAHYTAEYARACAE